MSEFREAVYQSGIGATIIKEALKCELSPEDEAILKQCIDSAMGLRKPINVKHFELFCSETLLRLATEDQNYHVRCCAILLLALKQQSILSGEISQITKNELGCLCNIAQNAHDETERNLAMAGYRRATEHDTPGSVNEKSVEELLRWIARTRGEIE